MEKRWEAARNGLLLFPVAALPVSLAYLSEFYYHPPELRQSVKYGQNMLKYAKKRVK